MFLSPEEIEHLTGRKRSSSQVAILRTMGIEHMVRPDGTVIVSRSHLERLLDGRLEIGLESRAGHQPNWEAI